MSSVACMKVVGLSCRSMELLAQIMTRVNVEGSTLVMNAVSQNDPLALRRALAIAPRGQRLQEVLTVTVGSQSISPLYWSIETGHLACARYNHPGFDDHTRGQKHVLFRL